MSPILAAYSHDPRLPEIVATLQSVLASEREKRALFYDEIADDEKGEFINGEVILHSPVRAKHTEVRQRLQQLIVPYCQVHQLGKVHT